MNRVLIVMGIMGLLSHGMISRAQTPGSNLKAKYINCYGNDVVIDSLPVIPLNVSIVEDSAHHALAPHQYEVEYNVLSIQAPALTESADSLQLYVEYRVLPYDLKAPYRRIDTTLIQPDVKGDYIGFSYDDLDPQETLIDFEGMNYSGSFSRGLSFGNRQNLVLNSSLNLQLAGTLGDDLEILAAISDNDIPIQPDGNTQQLQEFDRIFIQISKGNNTLRAGDFEIGRPNSYFMNYFKRAQGLYVENETMVGDEGIWRSSASVSISKGKFRRQIVTPNEGNQGPYKLIGNDNEVFIIVLANTERVFLDGELMKRGLEYDYVIDYNRGEVTFTAKRLIHKDVRIIVEFEYSDQNYLRSMQTVSTSLETEKWTVDINYFSEQDSRTSLGNQQLTEEDQLILSQIGDDLDKAFINSIRPPPEMDGLPQNAVLYELRDTILEDGTPVRDILVFSNDEEQDLFQATFTDVGEGNGDYIIGANLANGRVYEWVSPDPITGLSRGRYVPKRRVITPKKQQMMTMGAGYKINEDHHVKAEFGISSLDRNRFSVIDNDNNIGLGGNFTYEGKLDFSTDKSKVTLEPFAFYEVKSQNFRAINQYRPAEFQRDWNIDTNLEAQEHLATGGFSFVHESLGTASYAYSGFFQQDVYSGSRHEYDIASKFSGYDLKVYGSELFSEDIFSRGRFSRPRFDVSKTFDSLGKLKIGVYGEREKNEFYNTEDGELAAQSFHWDIGKVYVSTPTDKPFHVGASYTLRDDILPRDGEFTLASRAQEWRFDGGWKQSKNSNLTWTFTSRNLEVTDTSSFDFNPQRTFLGRINYQLNALKNVIRSNTAYEVGSGQEPRLEFTYIEVRPGEGQYIWTDLNGDGIQQLDEFQLAPFPDEANFIRVANITGEFVRTDNVLFNQQLLIDPRAVWYGEKGLKKLISRFSFQSNVNLQRRSSEGADVDVWNPFDLDFEDERTIFLGAVSRHSLFFNRANPKFEMQYNIRDIKNRNLLTTGFESRLNIENDITTRWNPGKILSLQMTLAEGVLVSETEAFDSRNFDIKSYRVEQELVVQPSNKLRGALRFNYKNQVNTRIENGERAEVYQGALEGLFNVSNKFLIRTDATLALISFDGQANSPLEFAMLEGLKDGINVLWSVQYEQRMANNIQLIVNYEGRKTGEANTVHVFRMQMRATF